MNIEQKMELVIVDQKVNIILSRFEGNGFSD